MKQTISILSGLLLLSQTTLAQQSWSLKQCIDYGLQNSPQLTIAANQKDIAHQQKVQSMSPYLPQITASGSLDDNLKRQVTVLPAGTFGPEPTTIQFGTKYNSLLNAQVSQTLFDYTMLIAVDASKENKRMANLSFEQAKEQLMYNISAAYYQVLLSNEQINILQDNKSLYRRLLPIMQVQADKGVLAKIEVDKVSVNLNNIDARISNVQNVQLQAMNALKFQMGMYNNQEALILTDTLNRSYKLPLDAAVSAFDFKSSNFYKIQESTIRLYEYDAKRIRANGYPKLSFVGNYGAQAMNNEFGELYKNLYDFSAIGLRLSVPIFDGFGRRSSYKIKQYEINNAKEKLAISEAQQKLQYDNAQHQMVNNRLTMETNQRNIELARKVFNTTNLQYEKGVAPLSDLLQSEQSLRDAQNNFMTSVVNYYQAMLEMQNANSTMNQFYQQLN